MSNLYSVLSDLIATDPPAPKQLGFYLLDKGRRKGHYTTLPHAALDDSAQGLFGVLRRAHVSGPDVRTFMMKRMMDLARKRLHASDIDDRDFFCSQISVLAYSTLCIDQNYDTDRILGCRYIGVTYGLEPETLELFFHTEADEFIGHIVQIVEQGVLSLPELDDVPALDPQTKH